MAGGAAGNEDWEEVVSNQIIRSGIRRRTISALGMFLEGSFLLIPFQGPSLSIKVICGITMGLSMTVGIRAFRSGWIEISDKSLQIRTTVRTVKFKLDAIDKVEITLRSQGTLRCLPLIVFKSGRKYKLGDFFMQKWYYEKTLPDNQITRVVEAINEALKSSASNSEPK